MEDFEGIFWHTSGTAFTLQAIRNQMPSGKLYANRYTKITFSFRLIALVNRGERRRMRAFSISLASSLSEEVGLEHSA